MTLLLDQHFASLRQCIAWEAEAEAKRLLERRRQTQSKNPESSGETLLGLTILESEPSLGGRHLVTLAKRNRQQALPWSRLRAGTPVVFSEDSFDGDECTGVVCTRNTHQIQVAINAWIEGDQFRLDRSPDEITQKRQLMALSRAEQAKGRGKQLRDVAFYEREPQFDDPSNFECKASLNTSQQDAVRFALSARDIAIIHGPPGTGKTTTVVELIHQAVQLGQRVLASGPSNTAVDNLLLRLAALDIPVVRLGHPARVAQRLQENTLDAQVEKHENMVIAREMLRESEAIYRKLDRYTRARPARGQRQEQRAEAKQLTAHAKQLERQAIEHILDRSQVVCMTTTGDEDALGDRWFDLAVVDEACQSTEPGCWIPLLRADKLVLAGDHCQLPPTVLATESMQAGFQTSLMQRLVEHFGDTVTRQLNVQYRMHDQIMNFSSSHFYDDNLTADESVATHALSDLTDFRLKELATPVAEFIDTAGAGWEEEIEPQGLSKRNPEEGRLILKKARELYEAGLAAQDIAVIAPYAAQVRWLRDHCDIEDLEIDTVDGFQGREKEAVLITMVRSNDSGEVGFLGDPRRMNVAITRARRKLLVVGDSATLSNEPFFVQLLDYFESIGGYHSVWEEME